MGLTNWASKHSMQNEHVVVFMSNDEWWQMFADLIHPSITAKLAILY